MADVLLTRGRPTAPDDDGDLRPPQAGVTARLRAALGQSRTAAALAAATLLNNAIQLVFVAVFTRVLGATGYGSLAALVSAFLILLAAGQAMQAAAAREAALGRLGDAAVLRRTLRSWSLRLLVVLLVAAVAGAVLRDPVARLIGVEDHPWGAAAIPVTGVLWILLSLQRGALQGLAAYLPVGASIVGEAAGRLAFGLVLVVALDLGVEGAFLATPLSFAAMILTLEIVLLRRIGPIQPGHRPARSLGALAGHGWAPVAALLLVAAVQNVDVIMAKRELPGGAAGAYAAAAVAAKSVVWVAVGLGLQLLPEATRRAARGLSAGPVLARAVAVLAGLAAPALLIFLVAGEQVMRLGFGGDLASGAAALPLLGIAMTLLAVTYLAVQYLLALHATSFLPLLVVVALAEPLVLSTGGLGVTGFAAVVLAIQAAVAAAMLVLAYNQGKSARLMPSPTTEGTP